MDWYWWLIIGWILHWLWGIWHSKEITDEVEKRMDVKPISEIPQEKKYQLGEQNRTLSTTGLKELKEMLRKTNKLLSNLDEKLANGEITEAKYRELAEKYRVDANTIKDLIAEQELLGEADEETKEVADAIAGLSRLGYRKEKIRDILKSVPTSGMSAEEIMKAVMAKV